MLSAEEIQDWEQSFKLADKVIARKRRGIPADRWATTDEMSVFVEACAAAMDCTTFLITENERLREQIHRIGADAMSLGNDAQAETSNDDEEAGA